MRLKESEYKWKDMFEDLNETDENLSKDKIAFYQTAYNLREMAENLNMDKLTGTDWEFSSTVGMDSCCIIAEHNDFSVRLFFEFTNTGFCDIIRHYTNSDRYVDEVLGSWHYSKYDLDCTYKTIQEVISKYFEKYE